MCVFVGAPSPISRGRGDAAAANNVGGADGTLGVDGLFEGLPAEQGQAARSSGGLMPVQEDSVGVEMPLSGTEGESSSQLVSVATALFIWGMRTALLETEEFMKEKSIIFLVWLFAFFSSQSKI